MKSFKQFYQTTEPVQEGLGDLLGDVGDKISDTIKQKKDKILANPIMSRLFNVENDIIKKINAKQFKELGQLLISKKIPQDFKFKRLTLFGNNKMLNAQKKTFRDVPLFFGIVGQMLDAGHLPSLQKYINDIVSAGVNITTYLNRLNADGKDIISFLMGVSAPNISANPNNPSLYEQLFITVIKTLLTFKHTPSVSDNFAVHSAIRMKSLPILKAFFEAKSPIKLTRDIQDVADQVDYKFINDYIAQLKSGKKSNTEKDFSKFNYDPKNMGLQKIKQADAGKFLVELTKELGTPIEPAKLANILKDKRLIEEELITLLTNIGIAANIDVT